jgi:RNA polymerase sigma factor (sigma-70 family)
MELNNLSAEEREKLVESALGLARWLAVRKHNAYPWLDVDDLTQEANIGLMIAAERYQGEISEFSTYATHWVRKRMQMLHLREQARGFKVDINFKHKWEKLSVASMNLPLPSNEDATLADTIPDHRAPWVQVDDVWEKARRLVDPQAFDVLKGRFELGKSWVEISREAGKTRAWSWNLADEAIKRLRECADLNPANC